jgi:hypothetical protein
MCDKLLGNKIIYEKELYDKNNNFINSINKKIISLQKSLKLFQYISVELIVELDNINKFCVEYYARCILLLVHKYQNFNNNLLHDIYVYLKNITTDKLTLQKLEEEYNMYTNDNKISDEISYTLPDKCKLFFDNINKLYSSTIILEELKKKEKYITVLNLIETNNFIELFDLCFECNFVEIFLFLYIFCGLSFNYNIFSDNFTDISTKYQCSISPKVTLTTKSSNTEINIIENKSSDRIFLINNMLYLKKYSRMESPTNFIFNIEHVNMLNFLKNIDDIEIITKSICSYSHTII